MTAGPQASALTQELWFATPVWYFDVPDVDGLNARCIEQIYAMRDSDPEGRHQSNQLGWQSRLVRDKPEWFRPLLEIFESRALEIARRCGYRTDLAMTWWANVNHQYAYNRLHVHGGNILSGAYYLKSSDRSGQMTFIDQRFLRQLNAVADPNAELRHLHYDEVAYEPTIGRCFIFPSWIPHYVGQNLDAQDRISVSFNLG